MVDFCRQFSWLIGLAGLLGQHAFAQAPANEPRKVNVSGTVTDSDGHPITNAIVFAAEFRASDDDVNRAMTKTDASGKYVLPEIDTGAEFRSVLVKVYAPKFAMQSLNVPVRGVTDIVADMQLALGTEIKLKIVDQEGKPIQGANVFSIATDRPIQRNLRLTIRDWKSFGLQIPSSDEDGTLSIPAQTPEQAINITLQHADFVHCQVNRVSPQAEPIVATMQRGEEVHFRVTCKSDPAAVSDATIRVFITSEFGSYRKSVSVAANGTATTRLPNLRASIRIEHPSLYGMPWHRYRPGSGEVLDFALYPLGTIRGRVLNGKSGDGAAGVRVSFVRDRKVIEQVTTDAKGFYQIEVPSIDFQVYPHENETWVPEDKKIAITVSAGKTTTLDDMKVQPRTSMLGRVSMPTGEPVENAIVFNGFREIVALTDDKGQFEVRNRDRREFLIQAMHPSQHLSKALVAEPDQRELEIVLEPEGYSLGMVVDQAGKPLAGISVGLRASYDVGNGTTSTSLLQTLSRDDGTFRFLALSRGMSYQAEVRGKERGNYSETPIVLSRSKQLSERRDRKPLVLKPGLLQEVRELARLVPAYPKNLLPLEGHWVGSKPLKLEDLQGKSVLLVFTHSPGMLAELDIVNKLYADKGLAVIGIMLMPTYDPTVANLIVAKANVSFPVLFDEGPLTTKYQVGRYEAVLLYGSDGQLIGEQTRPLVRRLRTYMLYEKK